MIPGAVGDVAGVSEGTIKLVYRLYYDYAEKEKLVKKEWIENGKANMGNLPAPIDSSMPSR